MRVPNIITNDSGWKCQQLTGILYCWQQISDDKASSRSLRNAVTDTLQYDDLNQTSSYGPYFSTTDSDMHNQGVTATDTPWYNTDYTPMIPTRDWNPLVVIILVLLFVALLYFFVWFFAFCEQLSGLFETLSDIGVKAGFSKLKVTFNNRDTIVYNYAMTLLALVFEEYQEHSHHISTKLDPKDIVHVLSQVIPGLYKTVFQVIVKSHLKQVPVIIPDNNCIRLRLGWRRRYKSCGTQSIETHIFIKAVFSPLSKQQRTDLLTKTSFGMEWLFDSIKTGNMKLLSLLLSYLEANAQRTLILEANKHPETMLLAAEENHSNEEMLQLSPEDALIKIINSLESNTELWGLLVNKSRINGSITTILHTLVKHHRHDVIRLIMSKYSNKKRIKLIVLQNGKGQAVITVASTSSCQDCKVLGQEWKKLLLNEFGHIQDSEGK